ncbi:FtsX-like permease family protein [Clostridium kluyveri]|uniref:FtsX-like permease family protein n=1 Tax=Clostridium kluyveri TaxID=1534 RepID=UPI0022463E71|nr:ABC transporter permease [Clostridium kluyveri]UZQ52327.1 ABC transporter permease [Clostridium kluyveri]
MNSLNMAFDNFRRNIKVYGLYVMSMIFSVLIYYNFIALKYNPDFEKAKEVTQYIKGTSTAVSYLLLLFIIFFVWFSSSFFLNQRKREIGIYAFMGVTNSEIALIYSIEFIFIGITAIVSGLFLGIIFCKLFLMMLAKVAIMNMKIRFFISYKAIAETAVTFFIIFFVNSILGYINIIRTKLIDLLNASKKEESYPKVSYIKGILSLVFIAMGYYFARKAAGGVGNFMENLPLAIIFVVIGTYWLFGAAYSVLMKFIINQKKILYRGINIVSISNIAFRIKNNYRTLAAVAILVTVTLTSYGTVASLKYFVKIRDSIQAPYEISYISQDNNKVKSEVKDKLREGGKDIILDENIKFLILKPHIENQTEFKMKDSDTAVVRYSDFIKISRDLEVKKLRKIEKEKLLKGEAFYVQTPTVVMSLMNFEKVKAYIDGKSYFIKKTYKTPLFGNGMPTECLILNDEDYNLLRSKNKEYDFTGLKINNVNDIKTTAEKLKSIDAIKNTLYVTVSKDVTSYSTFGIIYFLGAFLALVFIIATGSIIYFKLVSEAYIDKEKYSILKRIGMTYKEIYGASARQIGISYLFPLIVGIIHSCVAMSVLSNLMSYNIIVPAILSIIIFIFVYGIYFAATTKKYLNIVLSK